jgi:hypothetical protein
LRSRSLIRFLRRGRGSIRCALSARFWYDRCEEKNPAAARQDKNQGMSLREHGRPETIKLWLRAQVNLKIFRIAADKKGLLFKVDCITKLYRGDRSS